MPKGAHLPFGQADTVQSATKPNLSKLKNKDLFSYIFRRAE